MDDGAVARRSEVDHLAHRRGIFVPGHDDGAGLDLMLRALQAGPPGRGLLFTSGRAFPRSRKNPGSLIRAVHAWLTAGPPAPPVTESWLLGPSGSS